MDGFQIKITASIVAWYGAIIASILAIVDIANFLSDRKKIKIKIDKDVRIFGPHGSTPYKENTNYVAVRIINAGRRKVIISTAGFFLLNGQHRVPVDVLKSIPITLPEGKRKDIFVEQEKIDFSKVDHFYVQDATTKTYKKNIANHITRFLWLIRRRKTKYYEK